MSNIDDRVVEVRLDNAQLLRAIKPTLDALDSLNKGLKLEGATKGLSDISAASRNFSLASIASGIDNLTSKFNSLSIIGITALTNIANKAVNAGQALVKSLTIDPVRAGLDEYETNLNSIQTILSNTAHEGTNLKQVNAALAELNRYSDQTIYNFGEMARNIGTFTAAGVGLKESTAAIKGIANLAAVSGSNSQQASTAMYQLSQALAAGKVSLMDWNSVVNAGMGGKVFQDALKETARVHGVAVDKIIKEEGSFRDSLQKGWITSEILTETLNKFTGDLNAKQLKSMGYNDQQIAGILKMGKTAQDAATKVKTMSQLIGTLQEAAGSGWSTTWQILFGDFDEAKSLFTDLNNTLSSFISANANARNKVLGDWKALGGRSEAIKAIANTFNALISAIKPVKDAFREIFPATTGKQLYEITVTIRKFTENLKMGADTADKVKRTFAGVFAVFGIGWEILKQVSRVFVDLFSSASKGTGGILKFTASIGDFLVSLHKAVQNGEGLTKFFDGIEKALKIPVELLRKFIGYISQLNVSVGSLDTAAFDRVKTRLEPLGRLGDVVAAVWSRIGAIVAKVAKVFAPLASKMGDVFSKLGEEINKALTNIDYNSVLDGINTGLFAGIALLLKKFLTSGFKFEVGGGAFDSIKESFEALTGTMKAMQTQIKANTLLRIAAAIGILTASVVALSLIDSAKLTAALTAMSGMFVQLLASMAIFQKISGGVGFAKLPVIATSLILLATAVDLLTIAVSRLSKLNWEDLAKGLSGVSVLIASLTASSRLMSSSSKNMVSTGIGLILLAAGIRVLVGAVEQLAQLSWGELSKGLVGVGVLLGSLALFTKFANANATGVLSGAGIVLLASGIKILASAMNDISGLSWNEIAKGLVSIAGGLGIIAVALNLIPPSSILSAAGVLVVSAALSKIGDAIGQMGKLQWKQIGKGLTTLVGALAAIATALSFMPPSSLLSAAAVFIVAQSLSTVGDALSEMGNLSWEKIAKGLVTLAGSLGIIALAMNAMTGTLPGAAALLVVAASLKILAPILQMFGGMSWSEMGKGLLMMAGVFGVIGLAGLALGPLVPVLVGLGGAIALMGAGMLAAGVGMLAFSAALTALSVAGTAGTAALVALVSGLASTIPLVMTQIGLGVVAFAKVIATSGPAITAAIVTVLNSLIDAVVKLVPKIISAAFTLINGLLTALVNNVPKMVSAGTKIIVGFLDGIARAIPQIAKSATNVIVAFLKALGDNLPKIVDQAFKTVIAFLNGIAQAIDKNSGELMKAGGRIAKAILDGIVNGLKDGAGAVWGAAKDVASGALDKIKGIFSIHSPSKEMEKIGKYVNEGFVKGLHGSKQQVIDSFNYMKTLLSDTMKASDEDVDRAQAKLKKLTSARKKDYDAIRQARAALAQANKEHTQSSAAYALMTKQLTVQEGKLAKLADQYAATGEKLKAAQQVLADAQKTRDDYNASVKAQYADVPEITGETKLADYIDQLKKKIADTKTFAYAIQRLRDLGLNDTVYKELIAKGSDALPFISQLLDGGKQAVDQINGLSKDLDTVAGDLGTSASKALYQAAVDSAAGIVKGLQNQQAAIAKEMDKIADAMVAAIKKKLGIKSPSREMAKVGKYAMLGLGKGLSGSTGVVTQASEAAGKEAILSMRKTLSNLATVLDGEIDMTPTIVPVLDLSSVRKDAGQIGSLLTAKPLSVGASYSSARTISSDYRERMVSSGHEERPVSQTNVTFNQTNTSPKPLSSAEIYRQTKNQISVAKGALSKPS